MLAQAQGACYSAIASGGSGGHHGAQLTRPCGAPRAAAEVCACIGADEQRAAQVLIPHPPGPVTDTEEKLGEERVPATQCRSRQSDNINRPQAATAVTAKPCSKPFSALQLSHNSSRVVGPFFPCWHVCLGDFVPAILKVTCAKPPLGLVQCSPAQAVHGSMVSCKAAAHPVSRALGLAVAAQHAACSSQVDTPACKEAGQCQDFQLEEASVLLLCQG